MDMHIPKDIAIISICGAFKIRIDENCTSWKRPTQEQIKNLHDTFNIDIELLDEDFHKEEE